MAKPVLIVVNGIPATGKTSLSRKLAADLGLPCIGKDDIKELLFDKLGVGDQKWSQDLGAATAEMLFVLIERLTEAGHTFMVESAFYHSFAKPRLAAIMAERRMALIEVYCTTDPQVRAERFVRRNESGERHPGHVDHHYYATDEAVVYAKYAPLAIGSTVTVDTTVFDEEAYQRVVQELKHMLATA